MLLPSLTRLLYLKVALSSASEFASILCDFLGLAQFTEKRNKKEKTCIKCPFTNLIDAIAAPGHSPSWISQLCTNACTIVGPTMPGIVHHSGCVAEESIPAIAATMAIHMADLIAEQERSLSSARLENRSCSRSSYLGDGCWQPTQALCVWPPIFPLKPLNFFISSFIDIVLLALTFLPHSSTFLSTPGYGCESFLFSIWSAFSHTKLLWLNFFPFSPFNHLSLTSVTFSLAPPAHCFCLISR